MHIVNTSRCQESVCVRGGGLKFNCIFSLLHFLSMFRANAPAAALNKNDMQKRKNYPELNMSVIYQITKCLLLTLGSTCLLLLLLLLSYPLISFRSSKPCYTTKPPKHSFLISSYMHLSWWEYLDNMEFSTNSDFLIPISL